MRPSRPERTPRGVLFDKDGTLVDFRACWIAVYRAAAADLARCAGLSPAFADQLLLRSGYDPHADRFTDSSPLLWATNRTIALFWARQPELDGVAGAEILVLAHFDDDRRPPVATAGLPELFDRLAARGLRLGVATMDTEARARRQAEQLGVAGHLGFVAGCDSGYGEKPGPGMVDAFCEATGLTPQEVVVVGDTPADFEMARRAGAGLAVAVTTGGTPREVLERSADHVIVNVAALPELLFGDA